jgi:hypothetical protein
MAGHALTLVEALDSRRREPHIQRPVHQVKYLVESWPPAWATVTRQYKGGNQCD